MNAEAKADAHTKPTSGDAGMTKFDAPVLKGIESRDLVTSNGAVFLPTSMAEAMELGKMMCLSNFVPPHLRGRASDCLAVVMQATRWGMDPFAVANKTYFVQERIAYESQLVNAVLNSRAPLDGRLKVEWDGEGQNLTCIVTGRIKGDATEHKVWQELATIKTKNSPLWQSSPRQQIAYYTTRMWARLYCPEVLLGVYTDDEVRDMGPVTESGTQQVIPPRPTRASVSADHATEQLRREDAARADQFGGHDPDTGEIEPEVDESEPTTYDFPALRKEIEAKLLKAGKPEAIDALVSEYGAELTAMKTGAPELALALSTTFAARRKKLEA